MDEWVCSGSGSDSPRTWYPGAVQRAPRLAPPQIYWFAILSPLHSARCPNQGVLPGGARTHAHIPPYFIEGQGRGRGRGQARKVTHDQWTIDLPTANYSTVLRVLSLQPAPKQTGGGKKQHQGFKLSLMTQGPHTHTHAHTLTHTERTHTQGKVLPLLVEGIQHHLSLCVQWWVVHG